MQVPIHLASSSGRSLQEQLFDQFVAQLAEGLLRPGMRMPATRQLAADLGVSRNTVVLAYERLEAEGFIEMRPPLGAFVTARGVHGLAVAPLPPTSGDEAAQPAPRALPRFRGRMHALRSPFADEVGFDFWVGRPDPRLFPAHAWRKLVETSLVQMQHGDGSYGDPAGLRALRAAVAGHVGAARGVVCGADDVIVTNGIQEGINIVARLLLAPGDALGMENPGYAGAANVFASHGVRLVPIEVDDEGAVPAALPAACRAVYLTPAHQYPSGVALSGRRRSAWLRWARECGGFLVEDDYDSDFYFDSTPMPAVRAEDRDDCVIYLGTFSKPGCGHAHGLPDCSARAARGRGHDQGADDQRLALAAAGVAGGVHRQRRNLRTMCGASASTTPRRATRSRRRCRATSAGRRRAVPTAACASSGS